MIDQAILSRDNNNIKNSEKLKYIERRRGV